MNVLWYIENGGNLFFGHRKRLAGWNFSWKFSIFAVFRNSWPIANFLWQPKSLPDYIRNLKVMVVLKTRDQGLSISGLIFLLPCCLPGWNFNWKKVIFTHFYRFSQFSAYHKFSVTAQTPTCIYQKFKSDGSFEK